MLSWAVTMSNSVFLFQIFLIIMCKNIGFILEVNGNEWLFAPHTRRAMVETRPGKFLVDLFSTIDYACVEHKTSESHMLDVNNFEIFYPS